MKQFRSYWKPQTARRELARQTEPFIHCASEQYNRLSPGDVLWIITAWRGGHLTLLGRLVVGPIVDQREAARRLKTADLWVASFHAIAVPGTEEHLREVPLSAIAEKIRFESKRDRLRVIHGSVQASQLQTMRQITHTTAELMARVWYGR
jgi:hypothetical protein